ncbi:MAG: ABC transporter ATP-binding protein [Gammaproteobacteria bacterium]|nr:ABC transporter ATP-binding protein [Gammaproteobacteria bacterium]
MAPILEVKNLRKEYRTVVAVDDISFQIPAGVCFGLLGPNGAGKTTTVEMIEGITRPTKGEIFYKGKPRNRDFPLQAGIQFQSTSIMEKLKAREILELFHGLYPKTAPLDELIELCDLEPLLEQDATKLSGGQKQRLMFALALINDPEIVFLDEPTSGLDPQARHNLWKLIERIKGRGKNVLLTTHYMEEAEILCDHIIIIDHGRIVSEGSPSALLQQHFGYFYVCIDKSAMPGDVSQFGAGIQEHNDHYEIQSQSVEDTLQLLMQRGVQLNSLLVRQPTLEDLFLKLTGHSLRE